MWGRVLDVINHAKFQFDRFMGFGAPGCQKPLSPIDWMYRPYNGLRTNGRTLFQIVICFLTLIFHKVV